jgi:hypothetical protein
LRASPKDFIPFAERAHSTSGNRQISTGAFGAADPRVLGLRRHPAPHAPIVLRTSPVTVASNDIVKAIIVTP